jgi:ATP-dependent Clp protease ATP-binding subunit ClpB
LTEPAIDLIAGKGFDPQYGARPIKRFIQKIVLYELSRKILAGEIRKDQEVIIERENDAIKISGAN